MWGRILHCPSHGCIKYIKIPSGNRTAGWEIPYKIWKFYSWENHRKSWWMFNCHVWWADGISWIIWGGQQFQHSAKIMRKIHFLVLKILMKIQLPSGKRPNIAMERSTMLLMGKSTFSMAMFNSFLYVHQRASHLCRSASEHPFLDRKKPHFGSDLSGVPSWELMPSWWVSLSIPMHRRCAPCVENFQPLFDYWSHWVYVNTC